MSRDIRGQPRNGQNIFLTVEFDQIDLAILYIELNLFLWLFNGYRFLAQNLQIHTMDLQILAIFRLISSRHSAGSFVNELLPLS